MAKMCEICRKPYPDHLNACPNCALDEAEVEVVGESGIDLGEPEVFEIEEVAPSSSGSSAVELAEVVEEPASDAQPGEQSPMARGESSAIDLGKAPQDQPESMSGVSAVEWAALVDEPPPRTGDEPGKVDAPSDAHLRDPQGQAAEHNAAEPAAPEAGALASEEQMAHDLFAAEEAQEVVDLGAPPPAEAEGASMRIVSAPAEELIDLEASPQETAVPPSEGQEIVEEVRPPLPGESGIDLGNLVEDVAETAPASSSGIDLSSPIEEVAASGGGSGVDLESVLEGPGTAGVVSAESGSGRDLIAEAVESGVDLGRSERASEEAPLSGEAVDLAEVPTAGVETPSSSAVDLGSGDVDLPPSKALAQELVVEAPAIRPPQPTMDAIDLEGLPDVPASGSGLSSGLESPASAVDLGSRHDVNIGLPSAQADSNVRVEPEESGIDLGEVPESGTRLSATAGDEVIGEEAVGDEAVVSDDAEVSDEAVVEDEEPVAARARSATATRTAPAVAAKPRSRKGAWFGGTFLGVLLAALTASGLWVWGIEPPEDWRDKARDLVGLPSLKKPGAKPGTGPGTGDMQRPGAALAESPYDYLHRGELEKAAQAGIEKAKDDSPAELAARGRYYWDSYVQKQTLAGKPFKSDDPAVKQAIADLSKATNNADAMFYLGQIQEMTGQTAAARKTYATGSEQFKSEPAQKRRFEAALDRLSLQGEAGPGAAQLPRAIETNMVSLAALLTVALQDAPKDKQDEKPDKKPGGKGDEKPDKKAEEKPDGKPGDKPSADIDEAGFEFWQAIRQARGQNYSAALDALEKARTIHDRRRFLQLRKAQNPLSDPTEEIFLRSCDELKTLWQMQERLKKGGYLDAMAKKDPAKALDEVMKRADAGAVAEKLVEATAEKLVKDKIIEKPEDLDKGVEQVLKDKKDAEAKVVDLGKMLKTSKSEADELGKKLKTTETELKAEQAKLMDETTKGRDLATKLVTEQKAMDTVAAGLKEGKWIDEKADRRALFAGLAKALRMAAINDPKGYIQELEGRVAKDEAELKERWRPEEMLSLWMEVLHDPRARNDLGEKATLDVSRVLKDEAASPADRARAEVIRGLALRNEEKFDPAKAALQKGAAGLKGDPGPWLLLAERALAQVSDPAAWYASRAATLNESGQTEKALVLLGRGLEVLPADGQAALLAQRALIELDAARASAKTPVTADPLFTAASKDAADSAKAGVAEGYFAAGRVAEEAGKLDDAIAAYRKALEKRPELDAVSSRYRIALARVLTQLRDAPAGGAVPPPPRPEGDKTGRLPTEGTSATLALRDLAILVVLGLQAPGDMGPGQEEAQRLADEILKAPAGSVPFDVRAQALAIKGLWTPALITYAEGLRRHLPPAYSAGLLDIVRRHPRLQRPDTLAIPNPLEAEKAYAAGLNFYFDRDYASAEKAFTTAVENDSQDARYFYFLGLSRLAQNKRDAYEDLDQGAILERQGRPSPAAVSAALERIQGPLRRTVNDVRNRPREK